MKILNIIKEELVFFTTFLLNYFPGRLGIHLRKFYYKINFKKLGSNFSSEIGFVTSCPKNITVGDNFSIGRISSLNACEQSEVNIGNNVSINQNVNITSSNGGNIYIGNDVLIAQNVVIRSANHNYKAKKKLNQSNNIIGEIKIGNNVWIGANLVILKNTEIGENSIIGAGTIISKNVEKNKIVVGNNQRILKNLIDKFDEIN